MRPDPLACALFIMISFVLAGLVHSLWLRTALSRRLFIPIDGGATFRGRRVFGENKTVRGFVVMIPATSAAFALVHWALGSFSPLATSSLWPLTLSEYASLGAWAGLGFMLGELPNSFVKRQFDVAPGQAPPSVLGTIVTFVVDRLDSVVGALIAISIATPTPWRTWIYVMLVGPAIHLAFSVLLYRLGVKARPA
jgi:CDP-diglyceride synthetase